MVFARFLPFNTAALFFRVSFFFFVLIDADIEKDPVVRIINKNFVDVKKELVKRKLKYHKKSAPKAEEKKVDAASAVRFYVNYTPLAC